MSSGQLTPESKGPSSWQLQNKKKENKIAEKSKGKGEEGGERRVRS
jgi:hypothetical protein